MLFLFQTVTCQTCSKMELNVIENSDFSNPKTTWKNIKEASQASKPELDYFIIPSTSKF